MTFQWRNVKTSGGLVSHASCKPLSPAAPKARMVAEPTAFWAATDLSESTGFSFYLEDHPRT